jgi:hypothetical protein
MYAAGVSSAWTTKNERWWQQCSESGLVAECESKCVVVRSR